jgi:tetrahydromethanopterin S-methyltransferase subunit B
MVMFERIDKLTGRQNLYFLTIKMMGPSKTSFNSWPKK